MKLRTKNAARRLHLPTAACAGGFAAAVLLGAFSHSSAQQPAAAVPAMKKAATDGKVWGGLIFASSGATAKDLPKDQLPKDLADLPQRLGRVFDFQHFELLGQHTQDIFREYESWVVPSKDLFLKIDSKGPVPSSEGGGMNLHLQFWQEQKVLVKTDTVLRPHSPLFIGGPRWRDGRLVFVLLLTQQQK